MLVILSKIINNSKIMISITLFVFQLVKECLIAASSKELHSSTLYLLIIADSYKQPISQIINTIMIFSIRL